MEEIGAKYLDAVYFWLQYKEKLMKLGMLLLVAMNLGIWAFLIFEASKLYFESKAFTKTWDAYTAEKNPFHETLQRAKPRDVVISSASSRAVLLFNPNENWEVSELAYVWETDNGRDVGAVNLWPLQEKVIIPIKAGANFRVLGIRWNKNKALGDFKKEIDKYFVITELSREQGDLFNIPFRLFFEARNGTSLKLNNFGIDALALNSNDEIIGVFRMALPELGSGEKTELEAMFDQKVLADENAVKFKFVLDPAFSSEAP